MSTATKDRRDGRVPVEHRLLGLDKRSFPYALFVVGVFLLATVVIPRIDAAIDWDDPVQAGDRLTVAGDVVFTPTVGWQVEEGERVGEGAVKAAGEATVVSDGVTVTIAGDDFDGTPAALLEQVDKVTSATDDPTFRVDGDPATVTTPAGEVGVIQSYSSVLSDGLVAAFVIDGTGVKVTAYGPPAQMSSSSADIDAMIASITTDGSAS